MKKYLNILKSLVFSAFMLSSFLSFGMEPGKDDIVLRGIINLWEKPAHLFFGNITNPSLSVRLKSGEAKLLNYTIDPNLRYTIAPAPPGYTITPPTYNSWNSHIKSPKIYTPSGKYKNFILLIGYIPELGEGNAHEIPISE